MSKQVDWRPGDIGDFQSNRNRYNTNECVRDWRESACFVFVLCLCSTIRKVFKPISCIFKQVWKLQKEEGLTCPQSVGSSSFQFSRGLSIASQKAVGGGESEVLEEISAQKLLQGMADLPIGNLGSMFFIGISINWMRYDFCWSFTPFTPTLSSSKHCCDFFVTYMFVQIVLEAESAGR